MVPKLLSIFLTLQTVLKLMMLSTDGDEGENSAGKKKRKKKKKKGCKPFCFVSAANASVLSKTDYSWQRLFELNSHSLDLEFELQLQFTSQRHIRFYRQTI